MPATARSRSTSRSRSAPRPHATHSGGVVDLDRGYGGAGPALDPHEPSSPARPLTASVGFDYDRHGRAAHRATSTTSASPARSSATRTTRSPAPDVYAQAEWQFAPRWNLLAGLRYSRVELRVPGLLHRRPAIPTTAARSSYSRTTPAAGLTFRLTPGVNLYAQHRHGVSRRRPSPNSPTARTARTGLNFALRPR